jgi:hypothetical protein
MEPVPSALPGASMSGDGLARGAETGRGRRLPRSTGQFDQQVVVFVADRLSTVTFACGVDGLAHEVTEENVVIGRRLGNRQYQAVCGYRFPLPPPLVTLTGRPCARCAAVLVTAKGPEPAAGRVRHPGHRQPGWWWRILHPGRSTGAGLWWRS